MKRTWQILNILSVAFALVMNYLVGAQVIDVPSINEVSDQYATLLTPASYAFSIWSLIYLLLVVFAVYQARDLFRPNDDNKIPEKTGPYFILANIGNGLWTYVFVSDLIGLSVIILVGMVLSLFMLLRRLDIALFDAPFRTILCVWWPLMIYTGWVLVASVVNIASWLDSLGIPLSPFIAGIVLIALCAVLLMLLFTRNVRELVLASTWGIIAIGVGRIGSEDGQRVMVAAFAVGLVLLTFSALHAYQNRSRNILGIARK